MDSFKEIVKWSNERLSPWKQDALRRLALSLSLTDEEEALILSNLKRASGFTLEGTPATLEPLKVEHFGVATVEADFYLKEIRDITGVNRLAKGASLSFLQSGLTIVYGRNGSGKSGFVRIFRNAGRTRLESAAKLRVLGDVYDESPTVKQQTATIVVHRDGNEVPVPWDNAAGQCAELGKVSVFDSDAAAVYVDNGNQIHYLPFGLSLPHKLNDLMLRLKDALDRELLPVTAALNAAKLQFPQVRDTSAQRFWVGLDGTTTEEAIDKATAFDAAAAARLAEVQRLLAADVATAVDLEALVKSATEAAHLVRAIQAGLDDDQFLQYRVARHQAAQARHTAELDASSLFAGEPLPGVGADTWRALWLAARAYSTSEAYDGQPFPVVSLGEAKNACVLCHQVLSPEASARLLRFEAFVSGHLAASADAAESRVQTLLENLPSVASSKLDGWLNFVTQVRRRNPALADALERFASGAHIRYVAAALVLRGGEPLDALPALPAPIGELEAFAVGIAHEAEKLKAADDGAARDRLVAERAELEDRKFLSEQGALVRQRRLLLFQAALFTSAMGETQTTAITRKANELIDVHLTAKVVGDFTAECEGLDMPHLKVRLARKSDQKRAVFQTNTGSAAARESSAILSEGEQRALALAAFFTELKHSEGMGPIVIDDPVSSLDRDRSLLVAGRIAEEAKSRQVIVFTHDLIFFNELSKAADDRGVTCDGRHLFATASQTGCLDQAGITWKGLKTVKRINRLRSEVGRLSKLATSSPTDYEVEIKNLYGRLRDSYERLVEEHIFSDIVIRGVDRVETQKLRYVHLSDDNAIKFHTGMTRANTYSHDNPASGTVKVPDPTEFIADLDYIDRLISDLQAEANAAEKRRPLMKSK